MCHPSYSLGNIRAMSSEDASQTRLLRTCAGSGPSNAESDDHCRIRKRTVVPRENADLATLAGGMPADLMA